MHPYMHIYTHTYMHTHIYTYILTYEQILVIKHPHTYIPTHTYLHIHTDTQIYIHTCIHIHTYKFPSPSAILTVYVAVDGVFGVAGSYTAFAADGFKVACLRFTPHLISYCIDLICVLMYVLYACICMC